MKHPGALALVFLLAGTQVFGSTLVVSDQLSGIETNFISYNKTELIINISELGTTIKNDGCELELPAQFEFGKGYISAPGQTILPSYSTLFAVPPDADLSVVIEQAEYTEFEDFILAKASEDDAQWLKAIGNTGGYYPDQLATFESAGKMRDINLARLTVRPVQYNADSKTLRVYHNLVIQTEYTGGDILPDDMTVSEAFYPIYRAIITNEDLLDEVNLRRGAYWIIIPSGLSSYIDTFADWHKAQGFDTRIILTSEIGSSPNYYAIKSFIEDEYASADIKPDYICLVGDVNISSGVDTRTYGNPYGFGYIDTDNYYSFLEGNDYFPEVLVGRISVSYSNDLNNYLNKYFTYARNPYMEDRDWYLSAVMVAGSNYPSPRLTKLWVREMLINNQYMDVDTFLTGYDSPYQINNSINAGVTWVNYRGYGMPEGWSSPYYTTGNVNQLSNGPRFGIMTSIVCGTGDYNTYSDCLGEAWIKYNNKGGPGFIGTTNPDTHTKWNNAIDCGIYWGLFNEGTYTLAQCQLIGKMKMYYAFPGDAYPGGRVESYFNSYNDLGDPAISCWTAIPEELTVYHVDSMQVGNAGMVVNVMDRYDMPVVNSYVCLWKDDEVYAGKFSDSDGNAVFDVACGSSGDMAVTVTKHNYVPYEGIVSIYNTDVTVSLNSFSIDDDDNGNSSGNGDFIVNPLETVELTVALRNFGATLTSSNVTAELSSGDENLIITSSSANFGDIAPGDSSMNDQPYVIQLAAAVPNNYRAELDLSITDDDGNAWQNIMFLPVSAVDMEVVATFIQNDDNGDNILDRGESGELAVELFNGGSIAGQSVQAILRTTDSLAAITDTIGSFGTIDVGGSVTNTAAPFVISVMPEIYVGHYINFTLEIICNSGQRQIIEFSHMVGELDDHDPIGPDNYGYYCFDNTDTSYLYCPEYEWIPILTSWTTVSIPDDYIYTRSLPFDVQYYGEIFDQFSISDNGYITLGYSWWSNFLNTNIPSPQCAPAMAAPFWDDLSSNGYDNPPPFPVRYYHDDVNGKFIIGWDHVRSNDTYGYQDFEIIILDTEYWPTPTGDNEIIFQYDQVTSPYSTSVGICSPSRDDGIQYLFNNSYHDGAASIVTGRAIKFTTGSDYMVDIEEKDAANSLPANISLFQNYPNPFNPSTNLDYLLPEASEVSLEIYDVLGRKVCSLVDEYQSPGRYSVTWHANDSNGNPVSAGVYFYRLTTGNEELVKKMILIK